MSDYLEFKDYLCFRRDKDIKEILDEKEELLLSDKVKKIIALGFSKERNVIITDRAFYNLEDKCNLFLIIYYYL